jgi:putative chitobiose transport system permease protein
MNLWKYFYNTIIITVGSITIDVVFSSLCAYPLACMSFYGKKVVSTALISTTILPSAAGLVVNYLTIKDRGLMNSYLGVILPGAVSVFSIILMRQAYSTIPKELIEAAKIDGASEIKVWYKIMIPEIMPAISTIIIFDFISRWNAFLWPSIVLQDSNKYPIATALKYLNGQFNYKFGYIAAGAVISIIPVIVIFLAFQKYFVDTMAGAVKG